MVEQLLLEPLQSIGGFEKWFVFKARASDDPLNVRLRDVRWTVQRVSVRDPLLERGDLLFGVPLAVVVHLLFARSGGFFCS